MAGKEVALVSFAGANLAKIDISTLEQALVGAQDRVQVGSGVQFLKMMNGTGEWVYGAEDVDVEPGSRWAVNPLSLQTGFIAWGGGGKPLGKLMRSIFQPAVRRDELQNVGKEWQENIGFQMQCVSGEDVGVTVEYTQNSYGGRAAFAEIVQALQIQIKKDPTLIVPVVTLDVRSYQHNEFGKINNPVFNIVDWVGMDGSTAAPKVEAQPNTPPPAAEQPAAEPTRSRRFAQPTNGTAAAPPPATPAADAGGAVVRRRRRTATA